MKTAKLVVTQVAFTDVAMQYEVNDWTMKNHYHLSKKEMMSITKMSQEFVVVTINDDEVEMSGKDTQSTRYKRIYNT